MQVGINITIVFQIVLFLIITLIVNKLIVRPVHAAYSKRDDKVSIYNAKTQANLNEIENKKNEYESKLQAVRAEITEYHNQLKSEAAAKAQAIIDTAKAESAVEIDAKRREIEQARDSASAALQGNIAEFASQIVSTVTKH